MIANTGTGSYLITSSKTPAADPGMGISCNVAAVPGTFILEAGIVTSGSVYNWFRERFYPPSGTDSSSYAEIDSEADSSPPGSRGVVLLPHFKGRGSPSWNPSARGAFLNLTPEVGRGDMARSILEGIALEIAENIAALDSLGAGAQVVQVSGGMTRSPLFNRIQADCYDRMVERSDDAEATALGAWMSAAVRLGLYPSFESVAAHVNDGRKTDRFEPDPANRRIYSAILEERRRLYKGIN
jgi:sugar (pentulose or hexulose) kinase